MLTKSFFSCTVKMHFFTHVSKPENWFGFVIVRIDFNVSVMTPDYQVFNAVTRDVVIVDCLQKCCDIIRLVFVSYIIL